MNEVEIERHEKCNKPMYLVSDVEVKNGKTIISVSGKATNKDGKAEDVYIERVLYY